MLFLTVFLIILFFHSNKMDTLESTQLLVGITRVEDLEDKQDYAENQSRCNIKLRENLG